MECGKAYCIDMLGAIHLLAYSWQQVESTTVQNCFTRAKFMVRENTGESEECAADCDSLLTEVLERQGSAEALHFESFRDLDSDVATSPDLTDSEIVAAVVPREVEDDENADDDGDDVEADPDPSPSLTAVADAVAVMRAFAEKKGLMARSARAPLEKPNESFGSSFFLFPRFAATVDMTSEAQEDPPQAPEVLAIQEMLPKNANIVVKPWINFEGLTEDSYAGHRTRLFRKADGKLLFFMSVKETPFQRCTNTSCVML
ncbi:hypothetical protein HPB50_009703 [Hyalomma asiaticum]|uniref:Uncharacterized protein n=1 Tax=Hyalomma asiaticum TaxID=266040 RepID=A0ACB7TFX9_HYAAI|nr:hypothetical protein HPB50_009703 [Hyalomma asiaticum]